jgi:3-carboxy-cis,cis-muconate cycloisomerase
VSSHTLSELPDFDPGFSTARMREIWSAGARVARFGDVEAALAHAAAEAGSIPASAASAIEVACAHIAATPGSILTEGWHAGTPVVVFLERVRRSLPLEHAPYLHFGATTQDIVDTTQILQIRDSFDEISRSLLAIAEPLVASIEEHGEDWVVGRTLLQPALPIQLSWRLACWLEPIVALAEEIAGARVRLPVQLGGPVGDLSSFRGGGERVVQAFAKRLALAVAPMPWHTDRGPIASSVAIAARGAGVSEKIATDLLLLSQREVAEVTVPAGGSSSMPHKKNAIGAVRAVAAARSCRGIAHIVAGAPAHELERAAGSWHAEWFAVPLAFHTAGAALEATSACVAGAVFDAKRASENLGEHAAPDRADAVRLVTRVVERYRKLRERS